MKKAIYLAIFLLFTTITVVSAQNNKAKASGSKPNIIFILADDLGIGDLSCYGSDNNKTPIIDKLAKSGMQFNKAYTAPLCGPSRSRILTGRYAFRTGAVNQDRVALIKPEDEVMIPTVLKSAGYTSAMVGKWSQMGLTPKDFGFDDYITFQGSGVYWSKEKKKAATYIENGQEKTLNKEVYMPDLMHDHLVNFLTENKKNPFFLYYSMVHVHALIQPTPDSKPGSDLYADNTAYMDKLVGKLLATLDDLKLREN
jgi:arylsulfatase A